MTDLNYGNDGDNSWNGKKSLKLRDFFTRQRQESDQESPDSPDLEFVYADTDCHVNEIAELYSYTEHSEFQHNVKSFEDHMASLDLRPAWRNLPLDKKRSVISVLLESLEVSNKAIRTKAARCFLYLLQGCWAECQSDADQQRYTKENVLLLYNSGVFAAFVELFFVEMEVNAVAVQRKVSVNITDNVDLRIVLNVLYIFVEVIRNIPSDDTAEYLKLREDFHDEVSNPIHDELLVVKLFSMITKFCSGSAPHYPVKKILLLIWKIILFTLGGTEQLRQIKIVKRCEAGLEKFEEDLIEIVKGMRASTPPAGGIDGPMETQNQRRANRQLRRSLIKQSSLDESLGIDYEGVPMDEDEYEQQDNTNESSQPESSEPANDKQPSIEVPTIQQCKGLPWVPKIRQKDLDAFLDHVRLKFVGFTVPNDRNTLVGLPLPIHEGIKTLKRYVYTSLAEKQIEREENILKFPLSQMETEIPMCPTELLYQAILPTMQQNIIALLKILLAAAPTSKTKTDSVNIMGDVLPEEMPMTVLQSMKLGTDVNRHKEIIVKAISGILLLLLKHFKLNHVYQFEFLSQYLVFANCIPLILKFLNQNISAYVGARNVIPILDFPACVIGEQAELTSESLEIGDNQQFCWRNVFSCINLLRILNKVIKWKHSRIMMLVVFKSAPILRRTLKVRNAMMQLYVLKLLKMQTKYLGRQWRKSNMKTISAIYQKVRHRLNDDWAYGNDLDAKPWDFQGEECSLRSAVDKFNNRRYGGFCIDPDYCPVKIDVTEVLATDVELTEEFKQHYELWLQQEVFQKSINWDELLLPWKIC